MAGWFELFKSNNGHFRFSLKASNGEILLSSESYASKNGAINGIKSVQANCTTAERYQLKLSSSGKAFFNLTAKNNQIIGSSEMYASVHGRDSAIASVMATGTTEIIKDLSHSDVAEPQPRMLRTSALTISQPLVMHLELGRANAADLAELFHELSVLYQMVGGSGLTFYYEQSKEKVEVSA